MRIKKESVVTISVCSGTRKEKESNTKNRKKNLISLFGKNIIRVHLIFSVLHPFFLCADN